MLGIGIAAMIIIMIIILVGGMQTSKTGQGNITNQSNVQIQNVTLHKPLNVGRHITVELNESMHFTVH